MYRTIASRYLTELPATWMKLSLKYCGQEGLEKDMVVGSGEAIVDQLKSV